MEGQLPVRSIYRGYQASAQTSLAVRLSIGVSGMMQNQIFQI